MAASTPTSIAPALNTEIVDPLILGYTREYDFLSRMFRQKDQRGATSLKTDFNSFGALAFAATTPGTDLTPTEHTVGEDGTVTASEKAVAVELVRLALELGAGNGYNEDIVGRELGAAAAEKIQTDIAAAFASFTNTTGTTTVDMSLADFEDALYALRARKVPLNVPPPDFILPAMWAKPFAVLAEIQVLDLFRAARTAGLALAQCSMSLDALGAVGMGAIRGEYLGVPIFATAVNTTANASADVVGFMGVPAAIGITSYVQPQLLTEDHVLGRSKYLVGRAVYGVGMIKDAYGQKIVTDA